MGNESQIVHQRVIFLNKNRKTLYADIQIKISDTIQFVSFFDHVFNNKLSGSHHIANVVSGVYGMLRNLCAAKYTTPIRTLFAKAYLIPVLQYGCELYTDSSGCDINKLNHFPDLFDQIWIEWAY